MYSLLQDLSHGTVIFDLVTLKFDLILKNFNLGCYSVMVAAQRASLSSDNQIACQIFAKLWRRNETLSKAQVESHMP